MYVFCSDQLNLPIIGRNNKSLKHAVFAISFKNHIQNAHAKMFK